MRVRSGPGRAGLDRGGHEGGAAAFIPTIAVPLPSSVHVTGDARVAALYEEI